MKQEVLNLNMKNVKSFIEEHKMVIAALGGITVGIALAGLLGNEKAKNLLRSLGIRWSMFPENLLTIWVAISN